MSRSHSQIRSLLTRDSSDSDSSQHSHPDHDEEDHGNEEDDYDIDTELEEGAPKRQDRFPYLHLVHEENMCKKFHVFPDIDSISLMSTDFREVGLCFSNPGFSFMVDPSLARTNTNNRSRVRLQTHNHLPNGTGFRPSYIYRKPNNIDFEKFPSIKLGVIEGGSHGINFNNLGFEMYLHFLSDEIVAKSGYLTHDQSMVVVGALELATHYQSELRQFIVDCPEFGIEGATRNN